MLRSKLFLLIGFLTVAAAAERVSACSCLPPPTVPDEFERSKNVVVASLEGFEEIDRRVIDGTIYRNTAAIFRLDRIYKGSLQVDQSIKVFNGGGGDCTAGFAHSPIGQKLLLFFGDQSSNEGRKGVFVVGLCGRSTSLDRAGLDLSYLDNRTAVEGKTRLSGSIKAFGENIELPSTTDLRISVSGKSFLKEVLTGKDGTFELWDMPPGSYTLRLETPSGWKTNGFRISPSNDRRGWVAAENGTIAITIVAKKHTEIHGYLEIDSSISGKVLSPSGTPMKEVCVSAYWLTPTSDSYSIPRDHTDENGNFSIERLPPGKYRIEVNCTDKITRENPFETFYHPDVRDKDKAESFVVGAGLSVKGLTIRVPETIPLLRIGGIVRLRDGMPVEDADLRFTPDDEERYEDVRAQTDKNGRFSFEIPQGASGRLQAETNIFDSEFDQCPNIVRLRPSRTGNGPQSSFDFKVDGKASRTDIQLKILVDCELQ